MFMYYSIKSYLKYIKNSVTNRQILVKIEY